jgi:hypothetical protein
MIENFLEDTVENAMALLMSLAAVKNVAAG